MPTGRSSNNDVKYPEDDPEKATIKITIDVGEHQAKLIQNIENAVFGHEDFLPNKDVDASRPGYYRVFYRFGGCASAARRRQLDDGGTIAIVKVAMRYEEERARK